MSNFISSLVLCLSIFPTWVGIMVLSFLTILVIFIVIKIVAFVLDALPFV